MRDIGYDIEINDIEFNNGDFRLIPSVSRQNAALITAKSAVNIMRPEWGVGINEYANNLSESGYSESLSTLVRQLYDDGAIVANANYIGRNDKGVNIVNIQSLYGE